MNITHRFPQRVIPWLSHRNFFVGILVFFIIEALWIALSGRFPMAFDEDFHLGLIKLYSQHLSPFWEAQPAGADAFGAVARDPSYLYHYLMGFPYRIIQICTDNLTAQVIALRVINISLFASGLIVWRKLLLKTKASRALVHSSLLIFVLIPIVPFLAAQINYDNLFIPIVALTLLVAVQFGQEVSAYKRISTKLLLQLIALCLAASLIKYAFLPILLALIVYVVTIVTRTHIKWRKFLVSLAFGWTLMTRTTRWVLVLSVLLLGSLFAERYVLNVVRYHEPVPDCAKVLSEEQCNAYGPWARNQYITTHKAANSSHSVVTYSADWFYGMWLRSFFAVDGPATNFETRGPLLFPAISAIILAVSGFISFAFGFGKIWRRYDKSSILLFITVIVGYLSLLWLDGYQTFVGLGQTVAINGRYLLPVGLPLIWLGGIGLVEAMRQHRSLKVWILLITVLSLAWGGGTMTYILRSRDVWYWPNSNVISVNKAVRTTVGPLTPGYRHPTQFMSRN